MSGSKQTTNTSQQTSPWAPQAAALTSAFSDAQGAYQKAQQAQAPTDFTAGLTPEQISTFQRMVGFGNDNSIPGSEAATGGALTGAGTNGVTGALSGLSAFNPSATNNPNALVDAASKYVAGQDIPSQVRNAMQTATETARDVTLPQIEQNAATSGNTNSSRTGIAQGLVQRGLAEQAANLSGTLSSNAFANGLNLANSQANSNNTLGLGALSSAGSLGNTASATGLAGQAQSISDYIKQLSTAATGGTGLQSGNQADLTNELQQYQSGVNSPFGPLSNLMQIIGSQNWGSQGTGTSTTTSTPSAWSVIGGLLGAAGSLTKGLNGLFKSPSN
jgi:hypothetical protein